MNQSPIKNLDEQFRCPQCKEYKPLSELEKRGSQKPTYCMDCKRAMNRRTYLRNREKIQRKRKEYWKTPSGKETMRRSNQTAYKNYPEKYFARHKTKQAVKKGLIEKAPCEVCGQEKVEAHHYKGYEEKHWYDIKWLCTKHHKDAHGYTLESKGLV